MDSDSNRFKILQVLFMSYSDKLYLGIEPLLKFLPLQVNQSHDRVSLLQFRNDAILF